MTANRTAHVIIEGRVQGVGYRVWTQRVATELELRGWVRNRADGSVEAVFQGPDDVVTTMLARCKMGPRAARVTNIAEASAAASEMFADFMVRETA